MSGSPFTKSQTATILAALRYWQRSGIKDVTDEDDTRLLFGDEIDDLCEMVKFL